MDTIFWILKTWLSDETFTDLWRQNIREEYFPKEALWGGTQLEARHTAFFICSQILVNIFISIVHIYLYQVVQVPWRYMAFVL